MIKILFHIKVRNFAKWKPIYDAHARDAMQKAGVIGQPVISFLR